MEKQPNNLHARLELVWWLITAVVVAAVLFPIYKSNAEYSRFYLPNALFVIVTITLGRYIFQLKHTFLAYRQWLKAVIAVLCIPLFLHLMKELNFFQKIAGDIGLEEMFAHLSLEGQTALSKYVRAEMLFFGTASVITSALMPFRLLISFWRTHNRGTV